jgi:hypothetical protein
MYVYAYAMSKAYVTWIKNVTWKMIGNDLNDD